VSAPFAQFLDLLALTLLLTLLGGLWRVFRGPTPEDRMLAGQLFGTTGVGILLVLATRSGLPALRDVAVVLSLLAIVTVAAFVGRVVMTQHDDSPDGADMTPRELRDDRA
jgi:multicomponent Na+:H+ antiporter subunit F